MKIAITTLISCLALALPGLVPAQETSESPAAELTTEQRSLTAIHRLLAAIRIAEAEMQTLRQRLADSPTQEERTEISEKLKAETLQFERLTDDLGAVATGIDSDDYDENLGQAADLSSEFEELLRPIVGQLKDLTDKPRQMEDLRSEQAYHQRQINKAADAIGHLDPLLATARDETVLDALRSLRTLWSARLDRAQSDLNISEVKLEEAKKKQNSLFVSARESIASFFRSRGRVFLTAVFAFFAVWLGIRLLYRLLQRLVPTARDGQRNFWMRLAGICVEGFALVAAIGTTILVLYSASDWVLLGLLLIFLAGLAWTGRKTLPLLYEQAKLLLNLGSVREGERVVVDGMPWIVQRINIYTDLVNPMLLGGRQRVPMSKLAALHSRPYGPDEAWFPTDVGDWVELSDGTFGELIRQTPHWVTVLELGGTKKGFKTMEFLSLTPRSLSGGFRARSTFGIDYRHQAIATTQVPDILRERVAAGLAELVEPEELLAVNVLFTQAGTSSLDYQVLVDMAGSAAPKRNQLQFAIQRICVDVCNDKNWVIPFTQVMLHHATAEAEGGGVRPTVELPIGMAGAVQGSSNPP